MTSHITDHAARAVATLRQQFKSSSDMKALAAALGARTQGLEDALWSVRSAVRDVSAQGRSSTHDATQAAVGKLLGGPPQGTDPTGTYEFWLDTQININKANGTVADIVAAQFWVMWGLAGVVMDDVAFPGTSAYGTMPGRGCVVLESSTEMVAGFLPVPLSMNAALRWALQCRPAGVRLLVGGWVAPQGDDPGTLFRLDSSTLDDANARLYVMLDAPTE